MKRRMIKNYALQFGSAFPKRMLNVKRKVKVRRRSTCLNNTSDRDVVIKECRRCYDCLCVAVRCVLCGRYETQETKRLFELGGLVTVGNGLVETSYQKIYHPFCRKCIANKVNTIHPTHIPGPYQDMVLAINNVSLPPAWARKQFTKSIVFDRKDGEKGETHNYWNTILEEGSKDAIVIN